MNPETMLLVLQGGYMSEKTRPNYTEMKYHNFAHVSETVSASLDLADYCEENGLKVDRFVLVVGALYHDAGYHEELDTTKFSSKEEYSAYIATRDLEEMGASDEVTQHIADCIRSTERGVACRSLEAKILRRADLANLGGPIGEMIVKSLNLFLELKTARGITGGPLEFMKGTRASIKDYLDEDVSFGDFDTLRSGRSIWLSGVEQNLGILDMLLSQPAEITKSGLKRIWPQN